MIEYLLDTNVVSELSKPLPDDRVIQWLAALDEDSAALSAITIGELRQGVDELAPGRKRAALETWLTGALQRRFEGRILPVSTAVAERWGRLSAARRRKGKPLPPVDGLIAATAQVHSLTLVTRNTADFAALDVAIFDPWKSR